MGYKPKRILYRLTFEDPDLEGLEVVAKSMSVDGLLKLMGMADQVDTDNPDPGQAGELFGRFAAALVSWNVEDDDGTPVPAAKDGLLSQDIDFVLQIITAYATAMTKAPPPLPGTSESGGTSPEAALALVSQSRSPGS